jgi:GDPmannose 4,6-dehydratase
MALRRHRKSNRKALITGITGQDGSYLAEFLLSKGYEVHGVIRRIALEDPDRRFYRIAHIRDRIHLHPASLEDYGSISSIIGGIKPHEVYHLAGQSFVNYSFEDEFCALNNNINTVHYVLSAIKNNVPECRFYFAGSSEMFGNAEKAPQNENSRFNPRSPYGIYKVAGFGLTRSYRETYGLFGCSGIMFNHESPRRGFEFVTRKITSGVAKIKLGRASELVLGNLDAKRDWGFAGDYVSAMWMMLQQGRPDDFVIATGRTHTVREFVKVAFGYAGMDWRKYVKQDMSLFRPAESTTLCGDYSKARIKLGWRPRVGFEELISMMVESDMRDLASEDRC